MDFSGFTYPRLLRHQAEQRPSHLCVVTNARSLTWKEVDEEAASIGAGLLGLGVGPGDKVGILLPNYGRSAIAASVPQAADIAAVLPGNHSRLPCLPTCTIASAPKQPGFLLPSQW